MTRNPKLQYQFLEEQNVTMAMALTSLNMKLRQKEL